MIAYNDMLRRAHGRIGLRPVALPAVTLGIHPWYNELPVHPLRKTQVPQQRVDALAVGVGLSFSGSYEGVPGKGQIGLARQQDAADGSPWFGPGVM